MIDVILAENTRLACSDPRFIRYNVAGVYLALLKKGLDARYVDLMSAMKGSPPDILGENSADVCCFGVFFGNKVDAFRLMENARRAPKAPRLIIAFGPFASVFAEEILSRGLADIVVSSDQDFVIPAILEQGNSTIAWEKIPNLSYRHEGKVIHTRKHSFHELDDIPLIGPFLYSQGQRPAITMTARGCQYQCVFCDRNVVWGGGVRNRSVENVLGEVRELVETHHAQEIQFFDEDFAADHKRLAAICEGMRRIKRDFCWTCSACVNSVNREMLMLMGHARCRDIFFGVESASPQVVRRIGKRYDRQEILDAVRWSSEAGIKVEVMLTISNPGETETDRKLTFSLLNELAPEVEVVTNRIMILPGTPFFRKGLRDGWFTRQSFFEDEEIIFYDENR